VTLNWAKPRRKPTLAASSIDPIRERLSERSLSRKIPKSALAAGVLFAWPSIAAEILSPFDSNAARKSGDWDTQNGVGRSCAPSSRVLIEAIWRFAHPAQTKPISDMR